jgi:phosphate:Na+ symporter
VNWRIIILEVVGGLVLFLYGVLLLARAVEPLAGDSARRMLGRFTSNRVSGVLTGAVATAVLDSSSVTIILVIALVTGGLLIFSQPLGVILGSNIGTTISSRIFALNLQGYSPLLLLAGFVVFVTAGRSERRGGARDPGLTGHRI